MPFQSPNYTQTPNDLFDKFLPDLGDAELKVLLAIIRQTFGFRRSKARISLSKLEKATGLSRQSVLTGASALEDRSLIIKFWDGGVTEYEILIDEQVNLLDRNGQVTRPVGQVNRSRTIKETGLNKDNKDIDQGGQAPTIVENSYQPPEVESSYQPPTDNRLEPDSPGAYRLFNLLGDELSALKRRSPQRFPSLACKRKFLEAEDRLGDNNLERAITTALEKPILSVSGVVAFVAKWDIRPPAKPDYPKPNGSKPAVDEGQRREIARALLDKAIKETTNEK